MVYFLYFFSKGRKFKVPPHILFKIFIYAMSNGVYSTRMIQQQCEENINYMWLLQGYSAPSHMIFQCFFARCTLNILMNLFLQLMEAINRHDTLTFNEVFIDRIKLEANANKYTFVWRKAVQKRLGTLLSKLAIFVNVNIRMYNFDDVQCTVIPSVAYGFVTGMNLQLC